MVASALSQGVLAAESPIETERQYLSGHSPTDAAPWEFECTGGRRSGQWTTIPVPSHWELQGFGTYNYGQESKKKADEHGLYRLHFSVPPGWKDRRIRLVFEGAMTDTAVKINGHPAGPTHQGGFTRFGYDITPWIQLGSDNLLEVDDAKVSADPDLELAERFADYWVFGGIYRPVYLEATPTAAIEQVAIDARADGTLSAEIGLSSVRNAGRVEGQVVAADGNEVGSPFSAAIPEGGTARVLLSAQLPGPKQWTAETPNLYSLRITLYAGAAKVHTLTQRFGFRTFEVRPGLGLYLNGSRILLKGVDRHSFRPETGRALTTQDCYDDARLIKEMNLNAVRMSHYPPDVAFLEACDELGLYVLDELTAWQHPIDTAAGRILVRELVNRDVNHPSILFWDNGNEGGFNRELDGEFGRFDPSHRLVLHPWEVFNGVDTKHYPSYADVVQRLQGPNIYFPTEMLHGIYDWGAGAGLDDFWKLMSASPYGGGGFIWVFADDGLVRTDQGGRVDVFSTFAPDGIVGPHHEKEGSFYTVKEIYSPVQIDAPKLDGHFDGVLAVHNHYAFSGLAGCQVEWRWLKFAGPADRSRQSSVIAQGSLAAPPIAPGESGRITLPLPANWSAADALSVSARGPNGEELWTWTWPVDGLDARIATLLSHPGARREPVKLERDEASLTLRGGGMIAQFDARTGLLQEIRRGQSKLPLSKGPRLTWARPAVADDVTWLPTVGSDPSLLRLAAPHLADVIEVDLFKDAAWTGFNLEISSDGQVWKTLFASSRRPGDGNRYEFPPQPVAMIRLSNLRRNDSKPAALRRVAIGYEEKRFPSGPISAATVTTGSGTDPATGLPSAWIESRGGEMDFIRWTMSADGTLRLDYRYSLSGEFVYHGITFDLPEPEMRSLRWLGQGPFRVWQNRLRGTWLGVHEIARNDIQAGESWNYPEFQGYFAGLKWARLETAAGPITVADPAGNSYLRVGTPRINLAATTPNFPPGDFSILHAIPPIGAKLRAASLFGPSSQWAQAGGEYHGSVIFAFGLPQPL